MRWVFYITQRAFNLSFSLFSTLVCRRFALAIKHQVWAISTSSNPQCLIHECQKIDPTNRLNIFLVSRQEFKEVCLWTLVVVASGSRCQVSIQIKYAHISAFLFNFKMWYQKSNHENAYFMEHVIKQSLKFMEFGDFVKRFSNGEAHSILLMIWPATKNQLK